MQTIHCGICTVLQYTVSHDYKDKYLYSNLSLILSLSWLINKIWNTTFEKDDISVSVYQLFSTFDLDAVDIYIQCKLLANKDQIIYS